MTKIIRENYKPWKVFVAFSQYGDITHVTQGHRYHNTGEINCFIFQDAIFPDGNLWKNETGATFYFDSDSLTGILKAVLNKDFEICKSEDGRLGILGTFTFKKIGRAVSVIPYVVPSV